MTIKDVRYMIEHRVLPGWFCSKKEQLIAILLQRQGNFIYSVMKDFCDKEEIECPYEESMFQVDAYDMGEGLKMIKLTMPEPEVVPACHCMYLLFTDDFEKAQYFTIEKEEPLPYLCSWDSEGSHASYGSIGVDEREQVERIVGLFQNE